MAKVPMGTSVRRKNVAFVKSRAWPTEKEVGDRDKKRAFYDAGSAAMHSQVLPPYRTVSN